MGNSATQSSMGSLTDSFSVTADESEDSGPGGDALGLGYGSDDGSDSDAEDSQKASKQASEPKQEISAPAQLHASTHDDSTASAQLEDLVHKEEARLAADAKPTLGSFTPGTQDSAPGHDTEQAMHIDSKVVEPTYSPPAADITAAKSEGKQQIKAEAITAAKGEGVPQIKAEDITAAKGEGVPQIKAEDITAAKSVGEQQNKAEDIRPDSTAVVATVVSAEVPDKMPILANGSTCIPLYSKGSR